MTSNNSNINVETKSNTVNKIIITHQYAQNSYETIAIKGSKYTLKRKLAKSFKYYY